MGWTGLCCYINQKPYRMTNILAKLFQDLHHKPLHHHIDRDEITHNSAFTWMLNAPSIIFLKMSDFISPLWTLYGFQGWCLTFSGLVLESYLPTNSSPFSHAVIISVKWSLLSRTIFGVQWAWFVCLFPTLPFSSIYSKSPSTYSNNAESLIKVALTRNRDLQAWKKSQWVLQLLHHNNHKIF